MFLITLEIYFFIFFSIKIRQSKYNNFLRGVRNNQRGLTIRILGIDC